MNIVVELTPLETLQGALTLVFTLISLILGLIMILKYFQYKQIQLALVGITWIAVVSPYWPDSISFILIITTGQQLPQIVYFFIAGAFTAPIYFSWMKVFTDFLYRDKQKLLIGIFGVIAVVYEILFFAVFFTDYTLIGVQQAPFYVEFTDFIVIYLLISISMFTVTGLLFAKESLKSENPDIRLKGKFLTIAFITFAVGTVIDSIGQLTEATLVIARIFVIIGAFSFYIGFTLPKFIKGLFIKE